MALNELDIDKKKKFQRTSSDHVWLEICARKIMHGYWHCDASIDRILNEQSSAIQNTYK